MAQLFQTDTDKPTFRAWLAVGLLCVVGCLNYLDRVMLTTMRESIVQSVPMTDAQFGLLTSVFLWVYGVLSPFAGYVADKFNRSRVIIFSLFIWSGVTWLTGHTTNFHQLLFARALMGVSEACYIPAALALIADYHKGRTRSLAVGIHMAGVMTGQSLGFLGGKIAENQTWQSAFTLFGIIGIGYSAVLFFLLRDARKQPKSEVEVKKDERNFLAALKGLFASRSFNILLLFWSLLGMVGWMIMGWLPAYYKEHFSLSQTMAGVYATGYIYPLSMVGVIVGGALADALLKRSRNARILVPAVAMCVAAPAVFIASGTDVLWIAIGGFMIYAFTRVFSDANLMPVLCMFADGRYIATGYGVLNLFACIIGGLGIYGSGVLRDEHVNMSLIFKIAAVVLVFCALLLFVVKQNIESKRRKTESVNTYDTNEAEPCAR